MVEWNSTSHWDNHATNITKHNLPFNQNQKYQSGLVVSDTCVILDHHPMSMLGKMLKISMICLKISEATQNFIYHMYLYIYIIILSYVTVFWMGQNLYDYHIIFKGNYLDQGDQGAARLVFHFQSSVRSSMPCLEMLELGSSAIGSQVNPYRTHRIPVGIPGLVNVYRKLLKMVIYSGFTHSKWWIFP